MKNIFSIIIFCFSIFILTEVSAAQNQGIGVGAMLDSPTGISLKTWVSEEVAIDGAISFTISENTSSLYLHSDMLYHGHPINEKLNVDSGELRAYFGGGIRILWDDVTRETVTALRAPAGINYHIEDSRAETFFELVPTIDFAPFGRFTFAGAIGFRYYLN